MIVNGHIAVLGQAVDPGRDEVVVDGRRVDTRRLELSEAHTTILLHKPAGYLVSRRDPHHSRTIYDLLPEHLHHLVPVGRLDLDTEGALLLSDNGLLVERLTHPRYQVPKVYRVVVKGRPDASSLERLRRGVTIEGRVTSPATVDLIRQEADRAEVELTLREGRKREVRLMCRAVGHPVLSLRRVRFAGIGLADLARGKWRVLSEAEMKSLRKEAGLAHGSRD